MEFTTQWKDYNACLEIKLKLTHRIKTMFCLLCNISQRWSNKQAIFVELCMANGFISSNEILDVGNAGAWCENSTTALGSQNRNIISVCQMYHAY